MLIANVTILIKCHNFQSHFTNTLTYQSKCVHGNRAKNPWRRRCSGTIPLRQGELSYNGTTFHWPCELFPQSSTYREIKVSLFFIICIPVAMWAFFSHALSYRQIILYQPDLRTFLLTEWWSDKLTRNISKGAQSGI